MAHAGERYDFVLNADQKVNAYWIRLRSNNCCGHKISQDAILKYRGSKKDKPSKEPEAEFRVGKVSKSLVLRGNPTGSDLIFMPSLIF